MRGRRTTMAIGLAVLVGSAGVAAQLGSAHTSRSAAPAKAPQGGHKGGTLKLLAKSAGGTLDPQINYTLQYWQLYQSTYDGLTSFTKSGGDSAFTVVPDLAVAIPKPQNGGRTWTFKLRKGIKFSNGQVLTTDDVV